MQCSEHECDRPVRSRGLCFRHRQELAALEGDLCSQPGCGKPLRLKGLCNAHYVAQWRGNPLRELRRSPGATREGGVRPCGVTGCESELYAKGFCNRHYLMAHRHGVTLEEMNEHAGTCAICHRREPLAVDHDHAHDAAHAGGQKSCPECRRGLLCLGCNVGLGLFGDDVERLLSAVAYLNRHMSTESVVC